MILEILAKLSLVMFLLIGYTVTILLIPDVWRSKILKVIPKVVTISTLVCILALTPIWLLGRTF